MEEKTFSPEQSEEVIELLDIVDSSVSEESAVRAEEVVVPAEAESEEAPSDENLIEVTSEAKEGVVEMPEPEAVPQDGAQEERGADEDAESGPESVPAEEDGSGAVQEAQSASFEERLRELEARQERVVQALEERLASMEKAYAELSENVESLSQQIAQAGAMFLEDASVRLNMEEMVSRMLDARLPAGAEQEEGESEQSLTERMNALERRMADAETRGEQTAAAAAARVIRDEIAAMKAEAAGAAR